MNKFNFQRKTVKHSIPALLPHLYALKILYIEIFNPKVLVPEVNPLGNTSFIRVDTHDGNTCSLCFPASASMKFLGNFQFLRVYYLSSQIAKMKDTNNSTG